MNSQPTTESSVVSNFLTKTGNQLLAILSGDLQKIREKLSESNEESNTGFENNFVYAGGDLNYLTDSNHLEDQEPYEKRVREYVEDVDVEGKTSTRIKKRLS
jgi:hypothetical protein